MGQGTKKKTESIPESAATLLSWVLMIFSAISVILLFAALPLYFQEGYRHIGSDKSYFFRTLAVRMGRMVLPVFGLWLVFRIAQAVTDNRAKRQSAAGSFFLTRFSPARFSLTDCFAMLFALSSVISFGFSHYRDTALWGTKGWYMGMLPQLTLVSIYFLLSKFQFSQIARWLLSLCLPVSAAVFLLGFLNRFGVWPIPMDSSGRPLYISTIGNINWYCCYAVAVLFVGAGLLWTDRGRRKGRSGLLSVYVFMGFATLITQGSESGIFAMAGVFLVLFIQSAFSQDEWKMRRFWQLLMLLSGAGIMTWLLCLLFPGQMNYTSRLGKLFYSPLSLVLLLAAVMGYVYTRNIDETRGWRLLRNTAKALLFAVPAALVIFVSMIVLNTLRPGSLGPLSDLAVFTFNIRWGSSRGATWTLGLRCFAEQDFLHKFIGIGPDCMADFLYTDASGSLQEAVREAFANKRLTNAHCELLTVLVNMGILGAISYAGMWISLLKRLLFSAKSGFVQNPYAAACGLGMLAYLLNNLWSFQQSVGAPTVFVIMGLGAYFDCCKDRLQFDPECGR